MSDLLKLKFIPTWDNDSDCEVYRVETKEVDKYLIKSNFYIKMREDESHFHKIHIGSHGLEFPTFCNYLSSVDVDRGTTTIEVIKQRRSCIEADKIEELITALEMLKPEMEKYRNTMRDKELAKEKRKALWLEKEPFEFIL